MKKREGALIQVGDVVKVKLVTTNVAHICAEITTSGPSHLGKEYLLSLEKEALPGLVINCWEVMADIRVSGKTFRLEKWNLEKI
jgi:hypothetical protein